MAINTEITIIGLQLCSVIEPTSTTSIIDLNLAETMVYTSQQRVLVFP